ncbi:putative bifunctional diguanylate cyclase/phosphodiesterase [Sphingomonas pokkalii]|uniref:GGDEF-domain containing protein n=1 Tax=Sphingomonas pokkalii TaxID=2175090 RepID=A0A2U0SJW7_9SPHN|nr:GGDEF domain-containing phosphodiesterase [Sphingomonas pokkalii]PVX31623.1 GGDEF-domain containing protein [Sphingomonas pokkalii]
MRGNRLAFTLLGVVSTLLVLVLVGQITTRLLQYLADEAAPPEPGLIVALLLNLALLLIGWSRHREASLAIEPRTADVLVQSGPALDILDRQRFIDQGTAMLLRAQRLEKSMVVLVLDIDVPASAGERQGRRPGDALLRAVAGEVAATMPPLALAAQIASHRFACGFLFDPDARAAVDRIADRLILSLAKPFDIDGQFVQLHCAAGGARSDRDGTTMAALLQSAEAALATAGTRMKGSRFAWSDRATQDAMQLRQQLEHALPLAIAGEEIVPYFEQQVDLASGRLEGFEVLARWEHPVQGMIGPDGFIAIAEETGLIADLSLSIMAQAFQAARDWDPTLSLSVNISPVQLRDAWLAQKIIKVLTETGFPASRLEVEITERALFDNLPLTQSILGSLKNQGIRIALDDFGTGYSSLAHLRALPFDRIKIDRSFVQLVNRDADSATIVDTIVRMGESLNLPITAEGVEDATIAARLLALGCAKAQGWHFGRPLPIAGARRMLAERRLLQQPGTRLPGGPTTSRRQAG